jgi:hypothetical protein
MILMLFVLALTATAVARAQGVAAARPEASPEKGDRSALIKSALASDRGEITVMEPSAIDGKGVIIGYSSGAVVNCYAEGECRAFDATPDGALVGGVRAIAVSRRDKREIVWVAYPHGILYRCADYFCRDFRLASQPGN